MKKIYAQQKCSEWSTKRTFRLGTKICLCIEEFLFWNAPLLCVAFRFRFSSMSTYVDGVIQIAVGVNCTVLSCVLLWKLLCALCVLSAHNCSLIHLFGTHTLTVSSSFSFSFSLSLTLAHFRTWSMCMLSEVCVILFSSEQLWLIRMRFLLLLLLRLGVCLFAV